MTDLLLRKGVVTSQGGVPGTAKRRKLAGFGGFPPGLRCSIPCDPICLEDTDADDDELVVRKPLSRLKRSRDALAPSAVESGSGRSGKLSPKCAGSTVVNRKNFTAAAVRPPVKRMGSQQSGCATRVGSNAFVDTRNPQSRVTHAFGRTLPGVLARYIIAAGVNCPRALLHDRDDDNVLDVIPLAASAVALPSNEAALPHMESHSKSRKAKRKRWKAWKKAGSWSFVVTHRDTTLHTNNLPTSLPSAFRSTALMDSLPPSVLVRNDMRNRNRLPRLLRLWVNLAPSKLAMLYYLGKMRLSSKHR